MNVGEKICSFKEKLGHQSFNEFGRAADVSGPWLNDTSKKAELKQINDMNNLVKLCKYLGITIDQFLRDDKIGMNELENIEFLNVNESCDDIGILLKELLVLMNKDGLKFEGVLMNDKSKEICKDSLDVIRILTKQHL